MWCVCGVTVCACCGGLCGMHVCMGVYVYLCGVWCMWGVYVCDVSVWCVCVLGGEEPLR